MKDLYRILDESSIVSYSDPTGNITYANDKFCNISEYSREELIGKNHRIINSGYHSKEFFTHFWKTISSGQVWKGEIKNKAKSGTFYWVFTTIIPMLDDFGKIREYVSIRYDITQNKLNELNSLLAHEEIIRSKINQEASEKFMNILTHDMRTPITSAMLSAQLIEKNLKNPDTSGKTIARVIQNLKRVDLMVTDLLNASKIRAGQKITLELSDCDSSIITKKTLDELACIHGSRFDLVKNGPCTGRWSASGIKRIIENLCTNAVKYGDLNTRITIMLNDFSNYLEISVHNFGETIHANEFKNLFDYLQRTSSAQDSDKKGWGLGLTLVKGMAESHGGVVDVSSKKDKGTIFKITLPSNFLNNQCLINSAYIEV